MKTSTSPLLALIGLSPFLLTGLASAQSWIGTTGDWNTPSNWAGGTLPTNGPTTETRVLNGTVQLTGAATTNSFWLGGTGPGQIGTATLNIGNGGIYNSNATYIGPNNGGTGTVNVSGTGIWNSSGSNTQLYIGISNGNGKVNVTAGGTVNSVGGVYVGYAATGTVTLNGASSLWQANGGMAVGMQGGNGTLTLESGGTLRVGSSGTGGLGLGGGTPSNGTLNLGSGGAAGVLTASLVATGAGSTGKVNFNHNESAYTFAPRLEGNLSVEQKGSGTTILTAIGSTYTGGTTVTGGRLVANNASGSAFGTGNVLVNANTTLAGSGRFTGSATINGTYAPGNSVGNLTSGALTIGATGVYEWEINKADGAAGVAGGGWDLATVNGALAFQPGATLSIESLGLDNLTGAATGFNESLNYLWTIATATGGITGAGNVTLDTSSFQNPHSGVFALTTSGNNLQLSYTAVPESAVSLLAAGAVILLSGRRKRIGR